jgi:ribonuclease HIII
MELSSTNEESPSTIENPYIKYGEMYRKASLNYYNRNKEAISEKRKQKYQEKKALQPPKEPKIPKERNTKNYYQEVYKSRRTEQRIKDLKEEIGLDEDGVKKILEKYKLCSKTNRS